MTKKFFFFEKVEAGLGVFDIGSRLTAVCNIATCAPHG